MWSAQIHGFLGRPVVSRSIDGCQNALPAAPRRRLTVCMSEPTATAPQRPVAPSGDRSGTGRGSSSSGAASSGAYRGRGSNSGGSSGSYRGRGGGGGNSSSSYRGRGSSTTGGGRGGGYAGRDSSGYNGRSGQASDTRGGQQPAGDGNAAGARRDATDAQEPSARPQQDGSSSPYQAPRSGTSSGQPATEGGDRPAYAPSSRGGYAGRSSAGGGYNSGGGRGGYEGGGGRQSYGGQQDTYGGGGRGMRRDPRLPPPDQGLIMNENIPSDTVRLVGAEKEMLGVMSLDAALDLADEQELDVIVISPDADPPVCRLVSYDKFKYEEEKAKKVQSKKQREGRVELKELKIRPNTDVHDYQVRLRSAAKFISKGNKVKLTCQFKGREIEFQSIGRELFEKFAKDLGDEAVIENKPSMQGRQMSMIIGKAASSST